MKSIIIEVAQNGYIVREGHGNGGYPMAAVYDPFVFESFDHLTEWLRLNLDTHAGHKKSTP